MERGTVTISCHDCVLESSAACEDCVVSFVLERDADDALVIDAAEARAVRLLAGVGLVPELRHHRRVS